MPNRRGAREKWATLPLYCLSMSKDDGTSSEKPKVLRRGRTKNATAASSPSSPAAPPPLVNLWTPEEIAATQRVLRVLLETKGFTRKELDEALQRPLGSTSRFLRQREAFSYERLEKMLEHIGVRTEEFLRMRDANLLKPQPPASLSPSSEPVSLPQVFRKLEEVLLLLKQHGLEIPGPPAEGGPKPEGEPGSY